MRALESERTYVFVCEFAKPADATRLSHLYSIRLQPDTTRFISVFVYSLLKEIVIDTHTIFHYDIV